MSSHKRTMFRVVVIGCLQAALIGGVGASVGWGFDDDPPDFTKLTRDLKKAYRGADYQKALEIAEKMHEVRPDDANTVYNIACMHCLLGDKDKAYTWLEKAIDAGYRDADNLVEDDDLKTIRGEDRFRALVDRLRSQAPGRAVDKKAKRSRDRAEDKEPDKPKLSREERMQKVGALTGQVVAAAQEKDYEEALKLALEAQALADIGLTNYNAACMYSLLNKKNKAFRYLNRAVELGMDGRDVAALIEDDADFDNVRSDPRYAKALKQARHSEKPDKPKEPKKIKKLKKPKKPKKIDVPEMSPQEHGARVGELTQELVQASEAGEREKALKIALKALGHAQALKKQVGDQAAQALGLTHYNVACMYSLLEKKNKAFGHLNACIDTGAFPGNLASQMEGDSDLDNIRKGKEYARALARAKKLGAGLSNARGERVEPQWKVTLPKKFTKRKSAKAPLIVALHPFGGNMDKTTKRWEKAASKVGAILLTPQGTLRMDDGVYQWGRRLDLIEENIMDAIDTVMDEYNVDEERIVLAGFSQGGWATWALALRNPDTFCGIIPVAGMFRPESETVFEDEDLEALKIFIMVGEDEKEQVIQANRRAAKRFKKLGAKVKLNVYDDTGHAFPENARAEQIKALKFVLAD